MMLQDVAQQLGLKTTALTYYFRYKEQLVFAVFTDSIDRLAEMAKEAAMEATPRARVDRYLKIYFDHYATSLRGKTRPLAILSEIRTLDPTSRATLLGKYQSVFRDVRAFFGSMDTEEQKRTFTASAHILNEALFWSAAWLKNYAIRDFDMVRQQMLEIFEHGFAKPETLAHPIANATPALQNKDNDSHTAFIKIATRLLNEVGYRGTSIDRIASELNLTKGSFYHHLKAKDDLILECFRNSYRRLGDLHEHAKATEQSSWECLLSILANSIRYQFEDENPLLRTTTYQALPIALRDTVYEHSQRTALRFTGLIVEAGREDKARTINPLLASHIIMSTINSAYDIRAWAARQGTEKAVDYYMSLLVGGIFNTPAHRT